MKIIILLSALIWIVSCKKENIQVETSSNKMKNLSIFRQEYKTDTINTASQLIDHWQYNIYGDVVIWDHLSKIGWLDTETIDNYKYEYQYNSKHKITDEKKYSSSELIGRVSYVYNQTDTLLVKELDYTWSGSISSDADTIIYNYDSERKLIKEYFVLPDGSLSLEYEYFYNGLNQVDYKISHSYFDMNNVTEKYEYKYDSYGNIIEEKHTNSAQNVYTHNYEYIYNSKGYIIDYISKDASTFYHEQIDYNNDGTIKSKIIYDNSNVKKYFYTYVYEYF